MGESFSSGGRGESPALYETLVEHIPIGVFRSVPGSNGDFEFVNPPMVEMFDAESREELRNHSVSDLYADPSDREALTAELTEGNVLHAEEVRLETLDGVRFWAEITAIADTKGGETYFDGAIQDITERMESEKRLTESEERHRSMTDAMDTSNVGTFILDEDLNVVWLNEAIEAFFGVQREELIGQDKATAITSEIRDIFENPERFEQTVLASYEKNDYVESFECHVLPDEDREERWLIHWSKPISRGKYAGGRIEHYTDITERKRNERQLAEERDKYETLVENTHDAIAIVQDGQYVYANPQTSDILGYAPAELVGQPFDEIIAPEDRELARNRYDQRLDPDSESPPAQYDARILTKEGDRRSVELTAAKIQYEGSPADLVAFRDVTKRKRYEQKLEALNEELEALNRLVRHDIRNDMSIISGWAGILEDHIEPEGQEALQKVKTSSNHAIELTKIARDYVEALTSETDLETRPMSVCDALSTELEHARESYPDATFEIDDEIPDVAVNANELLGSIFRNILNNAVQHNDKDTPVIEVSCEERVDAVVIRIADNGPGIPDSQKETIFGKGDKGLESPGTGIGLYLVRRLIEQYDGRVWVEDNEPSGTVFGVELSKTN